jgi:hypothetical protein
VLCVEINISGVSVNNGLCHFHPIYRFAHSEPVPVLPYVSGTGSRWRYYIIINQWPCAFPLPSYCCTSHDHN